MFIFFATSERWGSMMTRYPAQSVEMLPLPQTVQLSPSTTRWHSLQTLTSFFLAAATLTTLLFLLLLLLCKVFFEPLGGSEARLPHGQADLAVPGLPLV